MKDICTCWNDVAQRISRAQKVFLFFDYDGTLTPIVEAPELAVLDPAVRDSLKKLSERKGCTVGIISGRGLDDICEKVGISGLVYAGNHGFEVSGPGMQYTDPAAIASMKVMRSIAVALSPKLVNVKGALLEDKVYSLSVHYRLCAREDIGRVKEIVDAETKQHRDDNAIRVTFGKKVLEVRPHADWHKGRIIEWLMEKCAAGLRKGVLVWYIGDDLTDEDAFKAVNKMCGISVLVGGANPLSEAAYYLKKQEDMPELMRKLEAV